MKLSQLFKGLDIEIRGSKETKVSGIATDSRTLSFGDLFIAKKGTKLNGAEFIQKAVQAGASAIVTDLYDPFLKTAQVIVKDPGALESLLAARFYGHPSKELFIAATTGTKGKTTTSYLIRHLLSALGKEAGLIGTIETVLPKGRFPSTLTTHPAATNQKVLREMVKQGCQAASLEVSSHGLDQGRVDEIDIHAAIFTNLYPDHLDYHKTMEEYAAAKAKLFVRAKEVVILNADSPWSPFMAEKTRAKKIFFGMGPGNDMRADNVRFTKEGLLFEVHWQGRTVPFTSSLVGQFNVYNLLAAAALGVHLGFSLEKIAAALATFSAVPGRLERVMTSNNSLVFVDFAHTGESLQSALEALRKVAQKRLIAVFGCGGDRDPGRRAGMGKAASALADVSIITSDNPRSEAPEKIAGEILESFSHREKAIVELDRREAIRLALGMAKEGDVVLIAGKGHEKVQIFANKTVPFDDVEEAESFQKRRKID